MADTDKRYTVMVYYTDGESELNENVLDIPQVLSNGILAVYRADGIWRYYVLRYVQSYTVEPQA